jgi:hypothetical protein
MSTPERRMASVESRPENNLIRALRSEDYALIAGQLSPWDSEQNHPLYNPGQNVDTVYFPCGPSLVSFRISNGNGRAVETVLVGREGAVGGIVSEGHLPAYTEIVVQFGGPFVILKTSDLSAAKEKSPSFRALFARYADCLWRRFSSRIPATPCIHSSSGPRNGSSRRWSARARTACR